MCMYVITDSKGNYIRKDGNKYVPVKSEKGAMQWAELSKATKKEEEESQCQIC